MQDRKRETADALQNVGGDSSRKRRAITHTFIIIALSGTVCKDKKSSAKRVKSQAINAHKFPHFILSNLRITNQTPGPPGRRPAPFLFTSFTLSPARSPLSVVS